MGAAAPPLGAWGWGALEVDLDPRLSGRLADALNRGALAIRLPLGVGGLKELGDSGSCVLADLRRTGAVQLEAKVQLRHRSARSAPTVGFWTAEEISLPARISTIRTESIGSQEIRCDTSRGWLRIAVRSQRDATPANRRIPLESVARDSTDAHRAKQVERPTILIGGVAQEAIPFDQGRAASTAFVVIREIHGASITARG